MKSKPTIHNPVNFKPDDYEVIDYFDNRVPQAPFPWPGMPSDLWAAVIVNHRREVDAWQVRKQSLFPKGNCYKCQHCGQNNVRYVVCALHKPSGDHVCFGDDCEARLNFANHDAFAAAKIRSAAKASADRAKIQAQVAAYLAEHQDVAQAGGELLAHPKAHARNGFASDVWNKLNHYGSLSDKQALAFVVSVARDVQWAAEREAREKDQTPTGKAEAGRYAVAGEIVHLKLQESDWGSTLKALLVRDGDKVKFWVTVPASIASPEKGTRVSITATWTPSKDDAGFAFGKRPVGQLLNK